MISNEDFYQKLRIRMRKWTESKEGKQNKFVEYLMFAPDLFHLLCSLTIDKEVKAFEKVKLTAALAYYAIPFDLIPEAIAGPAGYVDDIAIAAFILNGIINNTNIEVIKRHWSGDDDVLGIIQRIIKAANKFGGGQEKIFKKVRPWIKLD